MSAGVPVRSTVLEQDENTKQSRAFKDSQSSKHCLCIFFAEPLDLVLCDGSKSALRLTQLDNRHRGSQVTCLVSPSPRSNSHDTRMSTDPRVGAPPSLFVELLAGSVGGAAQVLVGQPLDTVKTRAQIAPS